MVHTTMNLHFKLQAFHHQFPHIAANDDMLKIVKALLLTGGKVDDVHFITNANEKIIMELYQCLKLNHYFEVINPLTESLLHLKETTKSRIARKEMAFFLQSRLCEENEDIEVIHLRYNVLTCRLNGKLKTVYFCSSKDYEFDKECALINTKRISAWHKSSYEQLTKYDYYAFLVKIDDKSNFIARYEDNIEGILLSKAQVDEWMRTKSVKKSGIVNFYIDYLQKSNANEMIRIVDGRNTGISLLDYYHKGFGLEVD